MFRERGTGIDGAVVADWRVDRIPKRRITSPMVTTMEMKIRTIIIHVWPVGY